MRPTDQDGQNNTNSLSSHSTSGRAPSALDCCGSAPNASSNLTNGRQPLAAARCNGDHPQLGITSEQQALC
eukprot:m.157263 g.157263  ORF g.157263 m.157263 type:complete len:71 (-) comp20850_c0_seq13:259-471(-)